MRDQTDHDPRPGTRRGRLSRRDAIRRAVGAGLALATPMILPRPAAAAGRPAPQPPRNPRPKRYNILLILVDQERHFPSWPFPVPGRERLRTMGVSFLNHQIASNVCSPSRSVIYTGQHIQQTRVFDNVSAPWQQSMSSNVPTVGRMLRNAGYYTAYKGKWHLSTELDRRGHDKPPMRILPDFLEESGFSDYYGVGDAIRIASDGYGVAPERIASLVREFGKALGTPWREEHRRAAAMALWALTRYADVRL